MKECYEKNDYYLQSEMIILRDKLEKLVKQLRMNFIQE